MVEAKQLLGTAGSGVQLLGVDANPHATSVPDVMAYSRAHNIAQAAQVLAQRVSGLLPGHPPLASRGSLAYISGLTSAKQVTLPGVGSGSLTLGPGRPRRPIAPAVEQTGWGRLASRRRRGRRVSGSSPGTGGPGPPGHGT
jgi:hypothetical protein